MTSTRVFHLQLQSLFKCQSIVFSEYFRQSIVFSSIFYSDRSLWEQKVAKESEFFVATFGRKLSSITLFVHARYGARKVLCTGLMECGGVLVQNSKVQVTPTRGQKIEHAALSRTLNLARCTQRKAPSSSHQPVWHSIWRYPTKRLRCQSNPGGWGVCCLWEILCNRGLVRCFCLLRKCADISAGCWIRHAYVRRVLT